MTIRCSLACTLFWPCVCRNIVLGRLQELLATRSALTTRVLCEALRLQESLVITVRCCQACVRFFALVPGIGFSIFLTCVGWSFFAGKEFRQQGHCVLLHFAGEFDVHVQLSFLLSARASCRKRIMASRLCASSPLARAHRDCVAGSLALCVSACGKHNLEQAERFCFEQSRCHLPPNADRRSCACT